MTIAENTFAAACFEQNSIEELKAALMGSPDLNDCAEWGITPEEWRAEIKMALDEKIVDAA